MTAPYLKKNLPNEAGALLPWILVWQFTHARAMSRVLGALLAVPPNPRLPL